jgi:plastocyanin
MRSHPLARSRAASLILALITAVAACSGGDGGGTTEPPVNGTVSGQVSVSGAGVQGATLTLTQGATTRTATSSAAGAYSFSAVPAGSWTVAITVPAGFALATGQAASVPVTVTGGQTSTVNFALAAGTVSGEVSASGDGVQGATLTLSQGATSRTATSSAAGAYSFSAVPAGAWTVEITVPTGFELATGQAESVPVTVTAGQTATANFELTALPGAQVREVELIGMSFVPATVTIAAGTTVRWINRSGGPHTVTPDGHTEWTSVNMTTANQTFEHTFDTAGTYAYYCDPHRTGGMTGVITVQ